MNPRALRLLRGFVVTATAVALSSAAHLAGGGAAPGPIGLVTALVLGSILGTALLAGDRLTPLRTAATIAGGQLLFHGVFSWGAVGASSASSTAPVGHVHDASLLALDALPPHDASAMLLAHVVAGVLSLAVLLVEQRLLDRLLLTARRALARLSSPAPTPVSLGTPPRLGPPAEAVRPPISGHRALVPRRGPPAVLLPA